MEDILEQSQSKRGREAVRRREPRSKRVSAASKQPAKHHSTLTQSGELPTELAAQRENFFSHQVGVVVWLFEDLGDQQKYENQSNVTKIQVNLLNIFKDWED